jgi:hypothetical protein
MGKVVVFNRCIIIFVRNQLLNEVHGVRSCRQLGMISVPKRRLRLQLHITTLSGHNKVLGVTVEAELVALHRILIGLVRIARLVSTLVVSSRTTDRHEVAMPNHALLSSCLSQLIVLIVTLHLWVVLAQAHATEINNCLHFVLTHGSLLNGNIIDVVIISFELLKTILLFVVIIEEHLFVVVHLLGAVTLSGADPIVFRTRA